VQNQFCGRLRGACGSTWSHASHVRGPTRFPFIIIFFFNQQIFFYISYAHNSSLQKKLYAQLVISRKSYAYSPLKKLYTQVILQTIVHTSCKFYTPPNLFKNYLTKIWNSQLCIEVYKLQKWKDKIIYISSAQKVVSRCYDYKQTFY
jgi:uncharacterized protein YktB (UPF0637 family)